MRTAINWRKVAFIAIGGITALAAFMEKDWAFFALGLVFVLLGLFSKGCAARSCQTGFYNNSNPTAEELEEIEVDFEEIK